MDLAWLGVTLSTISVSKITLFEIQKQFSASGPIRDLSTKDLSEKNSTEWRWYQVCTEVYQPMPADGVTGNFILRFWPSDFVISVLKSILGSIVPTSYLPSRVN